MREVIDEANDLKRLREFIYKRTGMMFDESKNYYVQKRIQKRMDELGINSMSRYYNYVRFQPSGLELKQLINALTINETYFFREYNQLKCFAEEVLPIICRLAGGNRIKVWSAGCSTGEEAYTLAIIMKEMLEGSGQDFEVHATDINTDVLEHAKRGVYGERSVKDVPQEYMQKYFSFTKNGYQINENIAKKVKYYFVNLNETSELEKMHGFHAIFCRNVLIYFDDASRRSVAVGFYNALLPGGFIFLGHSESMSRITPIFKIKRFKNAIIYQK